MGYTRIDVRPITGALGAEVSGIRLAEPLDEETFRELRDALSTPGTDYPGRRATVRRIRNRRGFDAANQRRRETAELIRGALSFRLQGSLGYGSVPLSHGTYKPPATTKAG